MATQTPAVERPPVMEYPPAARYDEAVPDHEAALARRADPGSTIRRAGPRTASHRDTVAALLEVGLPMTAKGPLIRRRPVVALAERLDLDGMAVRRMQRLARKYGPGPLLLRIPSAARHAPGAGGRPSRPAR